MKLAIPTNDGENLAPRFESAKGFTILELSGNLVISSSLRWNKLSDILVSDAGLFTPVVDCEVLLVKAIGSFSRAWLLEHGKKIILTDISNITNAYLAYLNDKLEPEPVSGQ
jgi:predicted Fe-Mo cluster-binding NifX family protein